MFQTYRTKLKVQEIVEKINNRSKKLNFFPDFGHVFYSTLLVSPFPKKHFCFEKCSRRTCHPVIFEEIPKGAISIDFS